MRQWSVVQQQIYDQLRDDRNQQLTGLQSCDLLSYTIKREGSLENVRCGRVAGERAGWQAAGRTNILTA